MGENKNNIVEELETAEVVTFGRKDMNVYNRLMANIEKGFTKASEAYVIIACNIWQIYHNEYYRIDNYKTISDFALEKYDFKKSTTHNYIKVVEKFGEIVNGKAVGLKEEFKDFKCSQLIYMLTFMPEQIEEVKPDWSVREIIAFGKNPILIPDTEELEESEDNESDAPVSSSLDDYMTAPEIASGKTLLAEVKNFDELIKCKDVVMNALEDMRRDANFKDKNVRLVIEVAYD